MGFTQTLWKDPKFGALSFMTQYSYVFRSPWYVAAGQPASAQTNMVFVDRSAILLHRFGSHDQVNQLSWSRADTSAEKCQFFEI